MLSKRFVIGVGVVVVSVAAQWAQALPPWIVYTNSSTVTYNGTSNYTTLPSAILGRNGVRVDLEFKADNTTNTQYLWYYADVPSGNQGEHRILLSNGHLYLYQCINQSYVVYRAYPFTDTSNWHHLVVEWQDDNVQGSHGVTHVTLDDNPTDSVEIASTLWNFHSGTNCHLLGAGNLDGTLDYFFDGQMRNVHISVPPSRGRRLLLNNWGLQRQGVVLDGVNQPNFDASQWGNANFGSINFFANANTCILPRLPAGTTWSCMNAPSGPSSYFNGYFDHMVNFQYGDEWADLFSNPDRLNDIKTMLAGIRHDYPNTIAHTNMGVGGAIQNAADLANMQVGTLPDMLCFDYYVNYTDFYTSGSGTCGRNDWYNAMAMYRNGALAGNDPSNDGVGTRPIAYGQYLNLARCQFSDPLPAESFVRLQQFASWTFGYTWTASWVYTYKNPPPTAPPGCSTHWFPVLFNSPGDDTGTQTSVFAAMATANTQSANLGPALTRLVSTDIRMKPERTGRHKVWDFWPFSWHWGYDYRSLPSGMSDWSTGAGGTNVITNIQPRGATNDDTTATHCDWLIGFFQPLRPTNADYPYANGLHFMITNGAWQGAASASAQWIRISFDFSGTGYTGLERLRRADGTTEVIPASSMTSLGSNRYQYDLQLEGGTGDLFRFYPQ